MSLTTSLLRLPQLFALLLIVAFFVLFGLVCFQIVNRSMNVATRRSHNDVAGFVFATVGVLYGVLLGFAVLVVWEQFELARDNASLECASAVALDRDLSAFPEQTGVAAIRTRFLEHVNLIVTDEYPALNRGEVSRSTAQSSARMWRDIHSIRPEGDWEVTLYGELLDRLNEMSERRAKRLDDASSELPGVLWIAMIPGGFITLAFTCLFGTDNVRAHRLMVVSLAVLIGLVVYVVVELDHPFTGSASVRPDGCAALIQEASGEGAGPIASLPPRE